MKPESSQRELPRVIRSLLLGKDGVMELDTSNPFQKRLSAVAAPTTLKIAPMQIALDLIANYHRLLPAKHWSLIIFAVALPSLLPDGN